MAEKGKRDFCIECRKETEYFLQRKDIVKTIRDKAYTFGITAAVCAECGAELNVPGLLDKNVQEIDGQYRAAEGLVAVNDIEKLMKIYKIGKAPLSLALGFGEVTIPRYLEGQVPSREYSDVVRAALASPAYMKQKLLERITHNETPWKEAGKGYGDHIPSSELLQKERIMKYYIAVNKKYGIDTENGLRTYIHDMLENVS